MFSRILSRDIRFYEEPIRTCLKETIPEYQECTKTKLFEELLFGIAQCWLSIEGKDIIAIVITKVGEDTMMGGKILSLISLYSPDGISDEAYFEGLHALREYAKSMGCSRLDFFTDNPVVMDRVADLGVLWKTSYYQLGL